MYVGENSDMLEFSDKLSVSDVGRLFSHPDDGPVTVWSMQQPEAISRLEKDGVLTGSPEHAFAAEISTGEPKPGKRVAYAWMQDQLRKRMPDYHDELPIWVVLGRPSFTGKENDRLLRIELPKSRILFSFHIPWAELLHSMAQLEKAKGWPGHWVFSPYVPSGIDDARRHIYLNGVDGATRSNWDEDMCRASWERIFDLTLALRDDFLWSSRSIQGTIPRILRDDVKEILPIVFKER
jgi:hypothetical protein